ncbi:hypothetical protein V6Z11_D10G130600 [Gossypium hirsutum]
MQGMQGGPSDTNASEGSVKSRKKRKTIVGDTNIVFSNEDEGSPGEEFRQKKRRDHPEIYVSVVLVTAITSSPLISSINSPPPSKPVNDDAFGVIAAWSFWWLCKVPYCWW